MEIQINSRILPLDLAVKYYAKWDCDIATKNQNNIYYKFLSGTGSVQYINGNLYSGTFENGLMSGNGVYQWKNGLKYEGEFMNNNVTGRGKLFWPDGSYYNGDVEAGKRQGFGQYYCSVDKSSYKGFWKDGLKEGKGLLTFSNGAVYDGEFSKGLREGAGKMRYNSGNEYDGEWVADKKEGKGTMNWLSSFQKYEGEWNKDLPEGSGSYYWFEGKNDVKNLKTIFKGFWKSGKRQGYGCFYYNNGCKIQGSFQNNLKEGLCMLTDQFGDCHIQYFVKDKSTLKKQQISQKQSKKSFKLPDLNAKKQAVLQNNQTAENIYLKFIDIKSEYIDQSIQNLLLRQNSQLRNDYKTLVSTCGREMFSGLTMDSLWKLIKDMKVTNQFISLAKINRQFYKGHKSQFQIAMPNIQKLKLLKQQPHLLQSCSQLNIEWKVFFDKVKKIQTDKKDWECGLKELNLQKVSLNKPLDLHLNSHTVLFRHFVVYLLQLALLQHQQLNNSAFSKNITLRKCFEDLLVSIKNVFSSSTVLSLKTQKACSEIITNVSHNQQRLTIPQQYLNINKTFFEVLTNERPNLLNIIDKTVTVKQLYCLLIKCGILKEASQKMLFLEKIERNMGIKGSILKKEFKLHYNLLQKVALTSPHFSHIMNYEMISSQFDEIIYILLNRKIGNAQNKEQFLKKYKQTIRNMRTQCLKHKEDCKKEKIALNFKFNRFSSKDKLREELLRRLQEEQQKKLEQKRKANQLKREQKQRHLMGKEDCDVKEYEESEQSEQYYD